MTVLPGDRLPLNEEMKTSIGPGIYKEPKTQAVIPTTAGKLVNKLNKKQTNQLLYIESRSKRYIPKLNDYVVGIVTGTMGESFKVSLQDYSNAVLLSMMAFPNASKKNRPNLKIGQAVYARVCQDIPEIDIEIECIDPTTGKEGGFGPLDDSGYLFLVNLNFANELLFNADSPVLQQLANKCKFEIAVGLNGRIWLKCGDGLVTSDQIKDNDPENNTNPPEGELSESSLNDLKTTLAASKFIMNCQSIRPDEIAQELKSCFKGI